MLQVVDPHNLVVLWLWHRGHHNVKVLRALAGSGWLRTFLSQTWFASSTVHCSRRENNDIEGIDATAD